MSRSWRGFSVQNDLVHMQWAAMELAEQAKTDKDLADSLPANLPVPKLAKSKRQKRDGKK